MTEHVIQYLLKEAEFLRNVYNDRAKETRLLERYSLIATGLIWSWCAANLEAPAFKIMLWMPTILTFLFGIRTYLIYRFIVATRDHLASLESKLGLPNDFGWGHHLKQQGWRGQVLTSFMVWFILQVLTLGLAALYTLKGV